MVLDILSTPQPGHDDRCSMATLNGSCRFRPGVAIRPPIRLRTRQPGILARGSVLGANPETKPLGSPAQHGTGADPYGSGRGTVPSADLHREAVISGNLQASWAYAESFVGEDEVLTNARAKAAELGCVPVLPGAGATLRLLAAASAARAVVEVGTGAGVGSVYLLRGMRPDGVLTTIDVEPEHHRAARETVGEAGIATNRVRLISGRALDVLPRLTDAAYDLVFCDADKKEYPGYLEQALRLLKPGGLVVFDNALWHDRVADPTQRDEETTAIRELGRIVREDERLVCAMIASGDGLLAAVKL
jgi:predicted O-methyltransferase YrrM